jgi:FKBP-type peptidyl-prolyl cis-trans isomerase FkpA
MTILKNLYLSHQAFLSTTHFNQVAGDAAGHNDLTKFKKEDMRSFLSIGSNQICVKLIHSMILSIAIVGMTSSVSSLAAPATASIVKTNSGLGYQELVIGRGTEASAGHQVQVHYTGWLQNPDGSAGRKFDSSLDRGDPFVFSLGGGQVIRGWDEGVAGMRVGGKRELIVPPDLGYGARGAGNVIPPNATLIFDVELLGVK